jgi:hypothetical protein
MELAKSVSDACLEGLRLLAKWKGVVVAQVAYKHSHPAAQSVLDEAGADMSHPGIEYERVVRYNYSQMERHVLVSHNIYICIGVVCLVIRICVCSCQILFANNSLAVFFSSVLLYESCKRLYVFE